MMSGKFHLQPVSQELGCCRSCHSNFFLLEKNDNKIKPKQNSASLCSYPSGGAFPAVPQFLVQTPLEQKMKLHFEWSVDLMLFKCLSGSS